MEIYSRILLATDFSEISEKAVEYCKWLELQTTIELFLLHVANPHDRDEDTTEFQEKNKQQQHKRALRFLAQRFTSPTFTHILQGNPKHEIIRFANEHSINQIVMGSHGYTGLSRLLLGSVAEHVIRHAHCAVTIIKNEEPGE